MPPGIFVKPEIQALKAITAKHDSCGGDTGMLGSAIEEQKACPDSVGFFRRYKNGMIYWSPSTDAHEVHGAILDKWSSLGFERSPLGYPVEDEGGTPDRVGRFSRFQKGMIYWTPSTGAHEIHEAIFDKWSSLGFERSFLGYPVTDETGAVENIGRFNRFQGGMIYWFPSMGAHELHEQLELRAIAEQKLKEKYDQIGGRFSPLGQPIDPSRGIQFAGNQFVTDYRGGQIALSSNDGPFAYVTHRTTVRFRGIHCFGKSEAVDEPYAIVGVYRPDQRDRVVTKKFPLGRDSYEDFVASTDASEIEDIVAQESPQTLVISSTVMEHDSGRPDEITAKIDAALKKAADAAGAATDTSVFTGLLKDVGIPELIAGLLGVGDDHIGTQAFSVDASKLDPGPPMKRFGNIEFNFESPLLSDGDASYKLYFEVFTEVMSPPIRL